MTAEFANPVVDILPTRTAEYIGDVDLTGVYSCSDRSFTMAKPVDRHVYAAPRFYTLLFPKVS